VAASFSSDLARVRAEGARFGSAPSLRGGSARAAGACECGTRRAARLGWTLLSRPAQLREGDDENPLVPSLGWKVGARTGRRCRACGESCPPRRLRCGEDAKRRSRVVRGGESPRSHGVVPAEPSSVSDLRSSTGLSKFLTSPLALSVSGWVESTAVHTGVSGCAVAWLPREKNGDVCCCVHAS